MLSESDTTAGKYLSNHNVLCLATTRDGKPWVSPVFYALWQGKLIFLSAPHTRHAQNLLENPLVSGSIQEDYCDWKSIKGIQLEGSVSVVKDEYRDEVIKCYSGKFPVTGREAPPEIEKALAKIHWFQLQPSIMYFIDNSLGLGHRVEIAL